MSHDPDLPLIDRILAGEQAVYATIVDRYKRYVYTIAFKVLLDSADAEEAAQDAFVKTFHYLKGFNRQSKFSTWLYRIAFNTAITHKRRQRKQHRSLDDFDVGVHAQGEGYMEHRDKSRFLDLALSRLGELDRTALTLFYLKEFSLEEIADIMGIQANTIKVRIHRARQRVAEELKRILQQEALTL